MFRQQTPLKETPHDHTTSGHFTGGNFKDSYALVLLQYMYKVFEETNQNVGNK